MPVITPTCCAAPGRRTPGGRRSFTHRPARALRSAVPRRMFAENIGLPFKVPEEVFFGCGPGNNPPCHPPLSLPACWPMLRARLAPRRLWAAPTCLSALLSPPHTSHLFHMVISYSAEGEDDGDDESDGPNAKLEQAFRELATFFKGAGERAWALRALLLLRVSTQSYCWARRRGGASDLGASCALLRADRALLPADRPCLTLPGPAPRPP